MSINWASTILCLASCVIYVVHDCTPLSRSNWWPLCTDMEGMFPEQPPGQYQSIQFPISERRVNDCCVAERRSKQRILTMTDTLRFAYQLCKAKHRWCSFDALFHEGARSVSLPCYPKRAANTLNIYWNNHITFELPDFQGQKSVTLGWGSISEMGKEACGLHVSQWSQPIAHVWMVSTDRHADYQLYKTKQL